MIDRKNLRSDPDEGHSRRINNAASRFGIVPPHDAKETDGQVYMLSLRNTQGAYGRFN